MRLRIRSQRLFRISGSAVLVVKTMPVELRSMNSGGRLSVAT
jgi:hypothetical protein